MEIDGRNILITGASRGLGAALARELASRGARLALVARGGAALGAVAAGIRDRGGVAHPLEADVSDRNAVYAITGAAAALLDGPIEVVIHNASALGPVPLRPLAETACEDLASVLEANLIGPFRLTKAVVGSMVLRGAGLVLQISSDASLAAYPGWGAYSVSKAALDHLGRLWARELAETGVRFLTVDPGEMDTRMHADAMPGADRSALPRPETVAARLTALIERAERVPSGSRLSPEGVDAVLAGSAT